jgi:hypothetical protein
VKVDQRIEVTNSDLTGPDGAIIACEALQLRVVDNVPAVSGPGPTPQIRVWPDRLRPWPADGLTLTPGQVTALWLTVHIPAAARPGVYGGYFEFTSDSGDSQRLPLSLRVYDLTLPALCDRELRVDIWPNWHALAQICQVDEWSEAWWELVEVYLRDLADHGNQVVQVGRSFFDWRQTADGQWEFGFERFDRYVKLCATVGIEGLIEYLVIFDAHGDTQLHYTDAQGQLQSLTANPGDEAYDELWVAFASALARHCRAQGWLPRLYICPTDEPADRPGVPTLQRVQRCRELLQQADTGHRTTAALNSRETACTLAPVLDRLLFQWHKDAYDPALTGELRQQGKLVEGYISDRPQRPNSFITSEAIEQRILGWQCFHEGIQGLMRWSYINWPDDLGEKPAGTDGLPPGDLYLVYPGAQGPWASTRWERLRDGFEDAEILRLANQIIRRSGQRGSAARETFDAAVARVTGPPGQLTSYTWDPETLLQARRQILTAVENLREAPVR